jgi:hypothetical protein
MITICQADFRAAVAWRKLRRKRHRRSRLARGFESVAAVIPGGVLLLHLLQKSAGVGAEDPARATLHLASESNAVAGLQLAVVPEPNATALVLLGLGVLIYLRRHAHPVQPSKMATAVA